MGPLSQRYVGDFYLAFSAESFSPFLPSLPQNICSEISNGTKRILALGSTGPRFVLLTADLWAFFLPQMDAATRLDIKDAPGHFSTLWPRSYEALKLVARIDPLQYAFITGIKERNLPLTKPLVREMIVFVYGGGCILAVDIQVDVVEFGFCSPALMELPLRISADDGFLSGRVLRDGEPSGWGCPSMYGAFLNHSEKTQVACASFVAENCTILNFGSSVGFADTPLTNKSLPLCPLPWAYVDYRLTGFVRVSEEAKESEVFYLIDQKQGQVAIGPLTSDDDGKFVPLNEFIACPLESTPEPRNISSYFGFQDWNGLLCKSTSLIGFFLNCV
jgi:hypothetical protein